MKQRQRRPGVVRPEAQGCAVQPHEHRDTAALAKRRTQHPNLPAPANEAQHTPRPHVEMSELHAVRLPSQSVLSHRSQLTSSGASTSRCSWTPSAGRWTPAGGTAKKSRGDARRRSVRTGHAAGGPPENGRTPPPAWRSKGKGRCVTAAQHGHGSRWRAASWRHGRNVGPVVRLSSRSSHGQRQVRTYSNANAIGTARRSCAWAPRLRSTTVDGTNK